MKLYHDQEFVSSRFNQFFSGVLPISKPQLNNISSILPSMIDAESVVTSDIARKTKDDSAQLESIERRLRRFFSSFYKSAYSSYDAFISQIINNFKVKHSDNNVHITFDHMYCKDDFSIILFSLRIGKQGIPLWFRCFSGQYNSEALSLDLIKEGISYCANLFKGFHVIFLADRWFGTVDLLQHIESLKCFYCIRTKGFFYCYPDDNSQRFQLKSIKPLKHSAKVLSDVFYTRRKFKTNIVISANKNTDDTWYILTNDDTSRAIRNYSYRFGAIECIFKSQKSNGFRLESTKIKKIEHFISLFTTMCIALTWLTILGTDYVKNKSHYKLKIKDVKKHKNNSCTREYSLFSIGLIIFNRCYYSYIDFVLKFDFKLYDV